MAFTQDLFTSRRNFQDGNTRIGETDRIWYDSNTNTLRISDGTTPGGIIITGNGTSGGNVTNNYGDSNVANYLNTTSITGNLDLGNLYITDQTLGGKITDRDITLLPAGTGLVAVPGLKVPVGSILQGVSNITAAVTSTIISSVADYSTGPSDNLSTGDYGLTNGVSGVTPGWTVYRAYGNVTFGNTIQVGDSFVGAGIPVNSTVVFVGNTSGTDPANANVIITTYTLNNLPPLTANTLAYTTRAVVNAGFAITTLGNTDITLNPGVGGNTVVASSIIPLVNGVYDLGTPTRRFKEVWVGAGTIYIQDETLGTDQVIGARDGNLYVGGGTGFTVGEWILKDNYIYIKNAARDAFIGTTDATGNLVINRQFQIRNSTGNITFQADRTGRTQIYAPTIPANDIGAFSIIGSTNNAYQPVINAGGMIHVTGNDSNVSRITNDAFGTGAFPAYISRTGRGNAAVPSASQQGDILSRISTVGWGTTNFAGASVPAATNIEVYARENFTDTAGGTEYRIFTAPVGTVTKTLSMTINDSGISFANSSTQQTSSNIGITFNDGTRQTTAFAYSNVVRKITTGVGFDNPGTYQGNVSLDTTDVHTLTSSSYSLTASNPGGNQYITLSLAQELSPNSSPTFANLTVSNLTVNGTFTTVINATINGKILYLANNSTSASQIDGGGIILGNIAQGYYRSILYDLNNDRWDTNGVGLKTLILDSTDANIVGNLRVNVSAHFGATEQTIDFPNATIQVDENINSYAQIVSKNHSVGTNASTDFVAVNDIGDDSVNYIDMGINSSNYTGGALGWTVSGANAGYLVVYGNAQLPPNGNLTLGTATANTHIDFHTSGTTLSEIRASITDSGLTTPLPITSTVSTGTAPLVIASTTKVNNLYANRASYADQLNPGRTINGTLFDGTQDITIGANASLLTGTYINSTVVGSSLTTVGNLTALTVVGNITAQSNITVAKNGIFNGNVITNYYIGTGSTLTGINAFGHVAVAGQTTIDSTTTNDTLTVIAGTNMSVTTSGKNITITNLYGNSNVVAYLTSSNIGPYSNANVASYLSIYSGNIGNVKTTSNIITTGYYYGNGSTLTGVITDVQPRTLTSTVHIAANVVGNTATIITDATTANVANTIVVRDGAGTINVSGWTVGTHLTGVNYTATTSDYWIGTTAKSLTITLPNAANGATNGRQYQIVDVDGSGNPQTTIAAQSPATVFGNQPSQQGQVILATYVAGVWYLN